jgi:hypothetical protein
MPRIMADHNVEGHLQVLLNIWSSPAWGDAWEEMGGNLESFERLGIAPDTLDTDLWQLCQAREIVLFTGNRNAEGTGSFEPVSNHRRSSFSCRLDQTADECEVVPSNWLLTE